MYSITEEFVKWLGTLGFAASTYPPKNGTEFVTVERTGGDTTNYVVERALLSVQLFAESRAAVVALAGLMKEAVLGMPESEENVFGADVLSDYKSNDLQAGVPSHTINIQVIYNN